MTTGSPMDLTIRAALHDELSRPIHEIIDQLKELNKQVQKSGQIAAPATRKVDEYGAGFGRLGKLVKGATGHLVNFAKVGVLGAAGVLGLAAKKVYDIGVSYQDSLNTFQAVTKATGAQMSQTAAMARTLGNDLTLPSTSAADAAEAMTELAKGGLSVDAAMKAAKGTLQLSAAAQVSAADAATIQVNALNQFGLAAGKAGHVADLLANTANASSGEITDMASALNYVGPVARDFGLSIDSVSTALGVLGNQGIIGSQAGTSLRGALVNLAKPTHMAKEGIKELNLQLFDNKGHFLGLRAMTDQLAQAQKKMNPRAFNAALAKTFGKENLAAIAALAAAGPKAYDKMAAAVGKSGGAADVAAAKTKGLGGAVQGLQSQLETVAIDVYTKAQPTLDKWVRGFSDRIPGIEKAVGGFISKTAKSGMALFNAARKGDTKAAGASLATMFGGEPAEWTKVINTVSTILTQVWQIAKAFFSGLVSEAKTALPYIITGVKQVYQWFRSLMTFLSAHQKTVTAIAKVVLVLVAAWKVAVVITRIWTAAQALFNAVMSANPITLVIAAVLALTVGVIYAYTHWKWFRTAVDAVWGALKTAWHWLVTAWNAAYKWVANTGVLQAVWKQTQKGVADLWHAIKWVWHWLSVAWDAAYQWVTKSGVLTQVWDTIKTTIGDVRDVIKDLWQKFKDVMDIAGKVGNTVSNAWGSVSGTLGHLNPFGDTAVPKAAGGSLGNTMGAASAINSRVPGNRQVTSSYRTHGLGSARSDHVMGRALDLVGTNLQAYASEVRKSGGYAQFHGNGGDRHLHVAMGANVRGGNGQLGSVAGPYGDTAVSKTRTGTSVSAGGMTVMPGAIQIFVDGNDGQLTEDRIGNAVVDGIAKWQRDNMER